MKRFFDLHVSGFCCPLKFLLDFTFHKRHYSIHDLNPFRNRQSTADFHVVDNTLGKIYFLNGCNSRVVNKNLLRSFLILFRKGSAWRSDNITVEVECIKNNSHDNYLNAPLSGHQRKQNSEALRKQIFFQVLYVVQRSFGEEMECGGFAAFWN